MNVNDQPLIYTTKGNLPIADLVYRTEWQDSDDTIVFIEEYLLGEEIVKRSVHGYLKKGMLGQAAIGDLT